MKPHLLASSIILIMAALFGSLCLSFGQETSSSLPKKLYQRTGSEGAITGTIIFTGEAPKSRRIDISADPVCAQVNPKLRTEDVIVNDGKLANVFVYIESGGALDGYSFEQPTSYALLEHKGCRYVPHLLGVRVGQPLMIVNGDPTIHNTHPNPKSNLEWNQSQAPGAPPLVITLERPEAFIPFKDNQHPWEKAYVGVFTYPFFTIGDESGYYKIEGLPPGKYTLVAWHERFGKKTTEVVIGPSELHNADFTFDAGDHQ